ncbi:NuoM family protein [Buchnera aphidicola]|uniref:NADH-quinone oxidoreductase subunit M n=1 Tax=Buchnera aphidicola (Therioaphis trifolii) TaxID=1241884 RepID=A0A4D6YPG5_9GAMM|nr:NADH-quinone oxidoreductase subunit M [Buchnera aphidicola]QCI27125.1 NADH-quinone oxidoreductase subunit M [Buchnera aphidicola (Therioaphis trifolii)]
MLILFLIIPLLGAFCCLFFEFKYFKFCKFIALFSIISMIFLSLFFWLKICYFNNTILYHDHWNEEFIFPWIPQLGISFHIAIDKLSLMMITLSIFLGFISILCSFNQKKKNEGLFYLNLLIILFGTIGVFISIDLFLFFCFWEIMLFPMYFLIIFWGNQRYKKKERIYTANQFLIYTQLSSMIMLFSIILLSFIYYNQTNVWTFDYNNLLHCFIPISLEYIIMLGFFIAFAVKLPIVPFHSWLLNAHNHAPIDSSVDLLGMLIKVSAYGLLRFNINLFKNSSYNFSYIAIFLGILTIFYSSWMAFIEKNIKKIIAYSSISHMGFILVAIYCNNIFSYSGSIIQMIFGSITTSALFILFSQLYRITNIKNITEISGLYSCINWIPSFFLFFLFSNLNFPGTINFVGEIILLNGIFINKPYIACILIFSLLFSVIYSLHMMHNIFYGSLKKEYINNNKQINYLEFSIIFILSLLLLFFGFFPNIILHNILFLMS